MSERKAPARILLFLTDQQHTRTKTVSKYLGKTMMNVVRDALLKDLDVLEERMRREENEQKAKRRRAFVPKVERYFAPPTSEETPKTVKPSKDEAELERCVAWVAAAENEAEMNHRVEVVTQIVSTSCETPEAAKSLVEALDERLKAVLEKKKQDPQFGIALSWDDEK